MSWSLVFISYFIPLVFVFPLIIVDRMRNGAALRLTRSDSGSGSRRDYR